MLGAGILQALTMLAAPHRCTQALCPWTSVTTSKGVTVLLGCRAAAGQLCTAASSSAGRVPRPLCFPTAAFLRSANLGFAGGVPGG